jgi:methylmalonyl-CoA mutase N-terminal domain/subunit
LKEYLARGTQIFPLEPSIRLTGDIIEYCKDNVPRMNTVSICGYHMREAGCTLIQEIAYGLSDAIVYVEEALKRGISIDEFAPRLSFLFCCGMNLFEEIAKIRAARRLWAKIMKERFKAKNPDSMKLRLFSATAASVFTSREPLNNIIRGTLMTLAAALAGCQAHHTTSYDEAYTIPSKEAQRIALRTQQIIAYETDAVAVADPLGGSYFLEYLSDKIEDEVERMMVMIEERGGICRLVENGAIQGDIARHAYESEKEIQSGRKVVVGANKFVSEEKEPPIDIYRSNRSVRETQISRLKEVKAQRNREQVNVALHEIRRVAAGKGNLMVAILSAVCEYATVGEICRVLKDVFGEYKEAV